jgi:hypothetical protein
VNIIKESLSKSYSKISCVSIGLIALNPTLDQEQ